MNACYLLALVVIALPLAASPFTFTISGTCSGMNSCSATNSDGGGAAGSGSFATANGTIGMDGHLLAWTGSRTSTGLSEDASITIPNTWGDLSILAWNYWISNDNGYIGCNYFCLQVDVLANGEQIGMANGANSSTAVPFVYSHAPGTPLVLDFQTGATVLTLDAFTRMDFGALISSAGSGRGSSVPEPNTRLLFALSGGLTLIAAGLMRKWKPAGLP